MIAFHFPPLQASSGIQRTLAFSRDLREHGWEPIVLSAHPRAYWSVSDDLIRSIPEGVPVYRPFALDTARHLSLFGVYPKQLALPDRWTSWRLGAIPCGRGILRRHRPDVIWSTFPIATAHVIGRSLAAWSGKPWVADFRDSMTEPEFPPDPTVRKVYRRIERSTVERAARSVFTTPGAVRMYAERYPEIDPSRWALIPNGYDEETVKEAERAASAQDAFGAGVSHAPMTLVHSGTLYPWERDPRPFFAAVASLRRTGVVSADTFRVVLRATAHDDHYATLLREAGIDDIVRLEPQVGYAAAVAEMLTAGGLLLFQAANCNHQIPAKLYEYLRARRPILAMTDAAGDTAGVLREAGIDTIVPLDSSARIEEGLRGFLAAIRNGTAAVPGLDMVARYSRRARARELAALLDEVAAGHAPGRTAIRRS